MSYLKKKISKIDAQEPLKLRNSLRQIRYTYSGHRQRDDARFHSDAWRRILYMQFAEYSVAGFFHFKVSNAPIFDIFFFK